VLTEVILATFRLNGRLLDVAQGLASEGGLTAAWWQVLGAVLDEPRTVPDVATRMGVTRQAVQRVADLLVERGVAEYHPNLPSAHRPTASRPMSAPRTCAGHSPRCAASST
jgi:DNA-binding MarR family transcriptional regulator